MYNQISAWLDRIWPLPQRLVHPKMADSGQGMWLTWLAIEEELPLHLAASSEWHSLTESRELTEKYVANAIQILGSDQVEEKPDKKNVISALGVPPPSALPIYLIMLRNAAKEELVYVGKTKAGSRFTRGHVAALKLHNPIYNAYEKIVYRCSVTCLIDDERVALEWISPPELAEAILDGLESQLIFELKPLLNSKKKGKYVAKEPVVIHIQNVAAKGVSDSFLDDHIIEPPSYLVASLGELTQLPR